MLDSSGKLICKEVRIENCSACNALCTICPRDKMTRSQEIMSNEHYVYVLQQAQSLGAEEVSIFGFGEPLLDNHVGFKVLLATKMGLKTHITTNASLLSADRIHDLLDAGLTHIRFSVHALHPTTFSAVHRGLNWFNVTKNIKKFVELNNDAGHPCTTHLTCIPLHGETVPEIREKWESVVDHLEVWRPHNWGGKRFFRKGDATGKCFRPFSGPLQVQADGDVIPCCFLTDGEVVLGNTYKQTIKNILNGDTYRGFQRKHETGALGNLPCGTCDQRFERSDESPLLFSNRDPDRELNKLSTSKISLNGGEKDGLHQAK